MKYLIFIFSLFIFSPVSAQHWAAIGDFNHGIGYLFTDTVADELYLIGGFSKFNSDTIGGIGRWNGSTMITFGCGVDWDCITPIIPDGFYPRVNGIIRYNGDIFVTGFFNTAGNNIVNSIARWDGTSWYNLSSGLKGTDGSQGGGNGLKVINNELYVFGGFDSVAGIAANSIGKYDGSNWSAVHNFPVIPTDIGAANRVNDIAFYNNEIFVCGNLNNLPTGTFANIIKWDGADWVSVGDGIRGSIVFVNKMLVYKNELIVGGLFSKSVAPNNPGLNIGKWNGTQWSELGSGVDGMVHDMKVHDDTLYVCGTFKHAGGIPADGIAKWDGSKWCGFGTTFDNVVNALDFYRDTLYIGGGFWSINGDSIQFLAKWTGGNYIDTCSNTTSVGEIDKEENAIVVYPNPVTGNEFTISFPFTKSGTLQVINVLGETVISNNIRNAAKFIINVEALSKGCYIIKVQADNKCFAEKILKQ
ncbi:MAG TPA: T9SS type A sorting domain-containing protein [Bacteroidales bacterium]|mgnify:FL=1|jgi:hypothetical protein|nr:T9SS type A sorting domain-containing protein [Bacteroidales bacterium]HPB24218.1 T9SS type A sorting domain-containing protein [Bacteroidales bacterium]HQN14813.1 T9SS type A sorting domain-containing protein [Bacteroidales bacterium]HQP14405.1 T9SS type A sorting domain-containing protein [Bacteroidales bacterium]